MAFLRQRTHGAAAKDRAVRKLHERFWDEVQSVTQRHASSWAEACAELAGAGFGPRSVQDLVHRNFVGVDFDLFRVDRTEARPGGFLLPRGIAEQLATVAADLGARAEAVRRHPSGSEAPTEERQAS